MILTKSYSSIDAGADGIIIQVIRTRFKKISLNYLIHYDLTSLAIPLLFRRIRSKHLYPPFEVFSHIIDHFNYLLLAKLTQDFFAFVKVSHATNKLFVPAGRFLTVSFSVLIKVFFSRAVKALNPTSVTLELVTLSAIRTISRREMLHCGTYLDQDPI